MLKPIVAFHFRQLLSIKFVEALWETIWHRGATTPTIYAFEVVKAIIRCFLPCKQECLKPETFIIGKLTCGLKARAFLAMANFSCAIIELRTISLFTESSSWPYTELVL